MKFHNILAVLASPLAALSADSCAKPMPVGGQAVIEGVLMKGYERWGMAVRTEAGTIQREHWPLRGWTKGPIGKLPVIRGFLTMIEMLREGFKALSRSAQISLGEEDEMTTKDIVITAVVAIIMVVGLFIALPVYSADLFRRWTGMSTWAGHIAEGIIRALVFVAYLGLIGLWKDVARILAYHGAEHKTINTFEDGSPMTVDSVEQHSRIHPRCGTSFLMIVVVISIIVFSLAGSGGILWRIGSRVALLPVVVGLSYEVIRAAANAGSLGRKLMAPALILQYLTTREPTREQLQVGISALEEALDRQFCLIVPGEDNLKDEH